MIRADAPPEPPAHLYDGPAAAEHAGAPPNGAKPKGAASGGVPIVDTLGALYDFAGRPRVSTGFPRLDELLSGGLLEGQLYSFAAPTGAGKTSWVVQMSAHRSERSPVVLWSVELEPHVVSARVLAQRSSLSWSAVLAGELPQDEARAILEPLALHYHVGPASKLRETVRAVADIHGAAPLVVVDYLQLIADAGADPRLGVAMASATLREVARHERVALLAVSAVGRAASARTKTATAPSDLVGVGRDSSGIEFDAAGVFVLTQPDEDDDRRRELVIAKSRFGARGRIAFEYDGARGLYVELGDSTEAAAQREAGITRRCAQQVLESLGAVGGGPLSATKVQRRDGTTWVNGRKQRVLDVLRQMVADGVLTHDSRGFSIAPA